MAKFKVIISDPDAGTSSSLELDESRSASLVGRRIGETVDGSILNLAGYKILLAGGSDKDGFPMRPSVHGGVRRKVFLSGGVGFNPTSEGLRKRKTIRGNIVTEDIVQINVKITEKPKGAKETKEGKEAKKQKKEKETAGETKLAAETQEKTIEKKPEKTPQ